MTSKGALMIPQKVFQVPALLLVLPLFLTSCSFTRNQEKPEEWAHQGNYIASYGPIYQPYSGFDTNTYYLYSSSGKELDRAHGPGSWVPVALPTKGGSYLYFTDGIKQYGSHNGVSETTHYSPIIYFGTSPEGSFAVAIANTSQSGAFAHEATVLKADGNTFSHELPLVPHSVGVSKDHAIIIGYEPEGTMSDRKIFLLDSSGNGKEISFPEGYDVKAPDFKYPHVNYLGDGIFEILQGDVKGNKTFLKAFEVRVSSDGKLDTQQITNHVMTLHDNFAFTFTLPRGENGFIDVSGNVFINRRDSAEPELTGTIESFDKNQIDRVFSSGDDPKFALKRDNRIEIRRWNSPAEVITTLPLKGTRCLSSSCGLSSVTEI